MKRAFPALLALLCATLALLIATSSSPLYATNFWTDTNIYRARHDARADALSRSV